MPSPLLNITETLPPERLELATARSALPSPLKSPAATERFSANKKLRAARNVPSPLPNNTETQPKKWATARSSLPSPLKSPTTMD